MDHAARENQLLADIEAHMADARAGAARQREQIYAAQEECAARLRRTELSVAIVARSPGEVSRVLAAGPVDLESPLESGLSPMLQVAEMAAATTPEDKQRLLEVARVLYRAGAPFLCRERSITAGDLCGWTERQLQGDAGRFTKPARSAAAGATADA